MITYQEGLCNVDWFHIHLTNRCRDKDSLEVSSVFWVKVTFVIIIYHESIVVSFNAYVNHWWEVFKVTCVYE